MQHVIFPLFKNLPQEAAQQIQERLTRDSKPLASGNILRLDARGDFGLLCLLEGSVVVELVSPAGKVLRLQEISAPDILAPTFTLSSQQIPVQLRCLSDIRSAFLPKAFFYSLLQAHAALLEDYMTLISARVSKLSQKLVFLQFKTIRMKLISYLLLLPRQADNQDSVKLPLTLTELADFFAVERPSLSTVLGELIDEGLIRKLDKKTIAILDEKRLIRASRDDGAA